MSLLAGQEEMKVKIQQACQQTFTPSIMQGAKGRGVDHVKVATVMTVEHAYTVRISQSLGGLGKRSSAVRRESVSKCKITGYCNCCLKFTFATLIHCPSGYFAFK